MPSKFRTILSGERKNYSQETCTYCHPPEDRQLNSAGEYMVLDFC